MTNGMATSQVCLLNTHEAWADQYQLEKARIIEAIGAHILDIQHVGSTSIPGVPAKPILDILVGVEDFETATVCIGPMPTPPNQTIEVSLYFQIITDGFSIRIYYCLTANSEM